uniref:Uncharacterized protein n=1 Tax=Polytomella parva TaxID=51329 RepID=A0A7S0VFJ2_9CHLO
MWEDTLPTYDGDGIDVRNEQMRKLVAKFKEFDCDLTVITDPHAFERALLPRRGRGGGGGGGRGGGGERRNEERRNGKREIKGEQGEWRRKYSVPVPFVAGGIVKDTDLVEVFNPIDRCGGTGMARAGEAMQGGKEAEGFTKEAGSTREANQTEPQEQSGLGSRTHHHLQPPSSTPSSIPSPLPSSHTRPRSPPLQPPSSELQSPTESSHEQPTYQRMSFILGRHKASSVESKASLPPTTQQTVLQSSSPSLSLSMNDNINTLDSNIASSISAILINSLDLGATTIAAAGKRTSAEEVGRGNFNSTSSTRRSSDDADDCINRNEKKDRNKTTRYVAISPSPLSLTSSLSTPSITRHPTRSKSKGLAEIMEGYDSEPDGLAFGSNEFGAGHDSYQSTEGNGRRGERGEGKAEERMRWEEDGGRRGGGGLRGGAGKEGRKEAFTSRYRASQRGREEGGRGGVEMRGEGVERRRGRR